MSIDTITRDELADLLEHHSALLVAALRQPPPSTSLADERPKPPTPPARDPETRVWTMAGELANQTYTWPEGTEHYEPFEVWETADARGRIQIGLGRVVKRGVYYGKERGYWVAFEMVNGQKRQSIVIFMEATTSTPAGRSSPS